MSLARCNSPGVSVSASGQCRLHMLVQPGAVEDAELHAARCAGEIVAVKVIDASTFSSIAQIEAVQEELAVLSGLRQALCCVHALTEFKSACISSI